MTHRTVAALDSEWRHVADSPLTDAATASEALADVREQPDQVLLRLIGQAQAGDELAGRTVVQALLGKLVRMAAVDRRLDVDDLVAALWLRIRTYPCDRRPAKVAANLVLDARKDVLAEQRLLRLVPPTDPYAGPTAAAVLDTAMEMGLIDETSRAVLGSVYADGLSSADAAARHRTTPAAVRWRCSRDVRRLAERSGELWEAVA